MSEIFAGDLASRKFFNNTNNPVFRVQDFISDSKTDSQAIKDCFSFASAFESKTIVFDTKNWLIDEAILVPKNTTVIVDGVTIKQKDRVFDNIFRSANFVLNEEDPNGFPQEIIPLSRIKIIGKNGAKLEGPNVNATMFHPTQKNEQELVGDYWGWRSLQICLSRVNEFEVGGFRFEKQRGWTISMDRCENGYLHDLVFNSTVKNGDGINVRLGCRNVLIENISGTTSDDLIAINSMTVGTFYPSNQYVYPMIPSDYLIDQGEDIRERDICNIVVDSVVSATQLYSHAVALLSRHGHKIYNVYLNNIVDGNPPFLSERLAIVGTYKGYGSGYRAGDMHTIRINNVVSNSAEKAIVFNDVVADVWINKVVQNIAVGVKVSAIDYTGITISNS